MIIFESLLKLMILAFLALIFIFPFAVYFFNHHFNGKKK